MQADAINQLAHAYGIESEYWDIWGKRHEVSSETKQILLEAMGIPAGDESAVAASLERLEREKWERILDPVMVIRGRPEHLTLTIRVPEHLLSTPSTWTLKEEDGAVRDGGFVPSALEIRSWGESGGGKAAECLLPIPGLPPPGYHRLEVRIGRDVPMEAMTLILAPERCYIPAGLRDRKIFGPAVQLYAIRSRRNWGIGDFTDLKTLVGISADQGAGIVGINPITLLFPENPDHASPYSPSTRLFLNFLYLDVEAVADFGESAEAQNLVQSPDFQARLAALRREELVDYRGVARAKQEVLEVLYGHFRDRHISHDTDRAKAFRTFQQRGGETLRLVCIFEAIQEHLHREDPSVWGWPVWPEEYRDPASRAVSDFAKANPDRVEFFQYLQWQADIQLDSVGRISLERWLAVGLYQDLPVGVDGAGAETWLNQDLFALGARAGAPPDDFNLLGQDWGLPPFIPHRLRNAAYTPFIATLRANMRHSGALRIDHVMILMRLFWVPPGKTPVDGAYVRYPFEDLLGILALESQRNRCLVIGEDLGTVPDELRAALSSLGVLSCRICYFEKDQEGNFKPPEGFPEGAIVSVSTHDLPTLAGYWNGRDIEVKTDLGLFPSEEIRERQIVARAEDRARLLLRLEREGLLPEGVDVQPVRVPEMTPELVTSIHRYLARTPCKILAFQFEDVIGQMDQANLPGTTDQHPNWRRKLTVELEALAEDARFLALCEALRTERGRGTQGPAGESVREPEIPRATYRIQLNRDFPFRAAAGIVPYLAELGISHCYVSPILKARPGSSHGYDIIDHASLNPEMGNREDFDHLVETLHRHGMGLILDVVPNHMGVGSDNVWWMDVLENGESSLYADFFDINWTPFKEALRGKVLLPVLEDHYGTVLEKGLLRLEFIREKGAFEIRYHEHRFPLDPSTYPDVLEYDIERLESRIGPEDLGLLELQSLIAAFSNLPGRSREKPEAVHTRNRDKEIHKLQLSRLCAANPEIERFIRENVVIFTGETGRPGSFDLLHGLLESQAYRLAYWRVATNEINYRRFFDINDLAGLRMENPRVFDETHRFVIDLAREGAIQGYRIDHPDGLFDPEGYFLRLQKTFAGKRDAMGIYLVAEKVLGESEKLPPSWPIHGTTGYDFSRSATGLFVDPGSEAAMTRIYRDFTGEALYFDEILYRSKLLIMKAALASELNVLVNELDSISESSRYTRDFTRERLRDALLEVVASFPVYRTYITKDVISEWDRRIMESAIASARKKSRAEEAEIYDFFREILLLEIPEGRGEAYRDAAAFFVGRFQQFTGPVMAKGLEDTACYRYTRLLSLNEVGSDPRRFGITAEEFHCRNRERRPHSLLTLSTHDSKRSGDVRAGICVISEIPEMWRKAVFRWKEMNARHKRIIGERPAPSANDEYLLYQTLLGAWPGRDLKAEDPAVFLERIETFMIKAVREEKLMSSWINPDPDYEEAVRAFVRAVLETDGKNPFIEDFMRFEAFVSLAGMLNSLSQTLLMLASPGVPDIYQGTEIWRRTLVDPDNRSAVDFAKRAGLLAGLREALSNPEEDILRPLVETMEDGRIKLFITAKALDFRKRHPELFQSGDYLPLSTGGDFGAHICAFARRNEDMTAVVAAPRLMGQLLVTEPEMLPLGPEFWKETWVEAPDLPNGNGLQDVFTGRKILPETDGDRKILRAWKLFSHLPVFLGT